MEISKKLIFTQIPQKEVNVKLIQCGNVIQVYKFENSYFINEKGFEKIEDKKISNIEHELIIENNFIEDFEEDLKSIEQKNIIRSRNELCRLVLTNSNLWKTFITLTFADDITDINLANKEFHKFITKIKKTFKDFSYVCVPEFQKNGRVHYHLLTNIDFNCTKLINENIAITKLYHNKTESQIEELKIKYSEENLLKKFRNDELNKLPIVLRNINGALINCKCTYNKKTNTYKYFKTIKYWNNGFSSVISIDNINVSGYMSKYMTKDIDNRLFSHRRYFYSRDLKKPIISYLNLKNEEDNNKFSELFNNNKINYTNSYLDKLGNYITFIEIKK